MFAAMHPSGPAAQSLRTRSGFSLPHLSVVGPVHGGSLFVTGAHLQLVAVEGANCPGVGHSHSSKSLSHASTSAARLKHRTKSACSAWSAHSSSFIESSLFGCSMNRFGPLVNL